jgi:peptide/nickel transport system permease protein
LNAYIIKRAFLFVPTLFLVATLVFTVLRLVPGDPAVMMLTGGPQTEQAFTEEDLQKLRAKLGTDKPIIVQYGKWISRMFVLDFGTSYFYDQPVLNDLKKRFPITLELTVIALLMAGAVAIPLGVMSAIKQDSWPDYIGRIITIGGIAVPNFWIGILLVFALANVFGWLPPLGYEDFWNSPLENLQQLAFPALALAFTHMAFVARVTRSAALEVAREDYIRTARSKGLSEKIVIGRHLLKNALLPVITVAGIEFGRLLGGTVLIETIFNVPGMGQLLIGAIQHRDYPMVQAIVIVITFLVLGLNLLVDLIYAWLNPRIRYS